MKLFLVTLLTAASLCAELSAQNSKILELGKENYASCALCHGADGKGAKAGDLIMAPSLHNSAFVKTKSAEAMVAVILKGILKEDNKYLQQMVPLEGALDDEKLAAVSTYVRSQFGGKKKELIKPNSVKKWRAKYKEQGRPWKRSELEGIITATEAKPPILSKVSYSVYEGEWNKLPDFSTMEPTQRGELKEGEKLSLGVAKKLNNNFGIVFEGNMIIEETDTYEFHLSSDDGSALVIDGEGVVMNDGVHGVVTKKAKEKLEAGNHTFKILYFEKVGGEELGFMIKSKKMGEVNYTKTAVKKAGKSKSYDPIIIGPTQTEAVLHRAFFPGSKPRAIAVGYPGGVNLIWNADTLNVDQIWRGEFVDVAPHWNGRGSGSSPLGEEGIKLAIGLPLQQLESLDEKWVPFSESKIKYERDKAVPEKEKTFTIKHPDYQFKGYRLELSTRFPTFNYHYQDLQVSDTFSPEKVDGKDAIVRTLKFSGDSAADTYFRISNLGSSKADPSSGWIELISRLSVKVEGAEITHRQSGSSHELLALIKGGSELKITYRWNN